MKILIDTREQRPWLAEFAKTEGYSGDKVELIRATLKHGDYSIHGYETKFAVERKSPQDFVSTISTLVKRAKMARADGIKLAVVIDGPINLHALYTKATPRYINRLSRDIQKTGAQIFACQSRKDGAYVALNWMLREVKSVQHTDILNKSTSNELEAANVKR